MKVLIVEDEPLAAQEIFQALTSENRDLKQALETRGATYRPLSINDIVLVGCRAEALELLRREIFDLVLLDLYLPEAAGQDFPAEAVLYGYDILKAARERNPSPEVIVLSYNARIDRPGLQQFEDAVRRAERSFLPDDILWKEDYKDLDKLQRKIASYLIDLSADDEKILESSGIYVPPRGMPSRIRQLLRQLKRIAWSAERGRPLPDVVLIGESGTGKATLAKAFHMLRPGAKRDRRLAFEHIEMAPVYRGGVDPIEVLAGVSGGEVWSLGALPRTTFYTRSGDWVRLPGQQIQEKGKFHLIDGVASARLYPRGTDRADFDSSGTLYVEDTFGDVKTQEEIERILSPDLDQRYVTTRGKSPIRLHVGSSLVLGFTRSYTPRVGQMVIEVPPLRDRSLEEKIWLLEKLVNRRRNPSDIGSGSPQPAYRAQLESTMTGIVGEHLYFRDNLDDLQAIANQVLPEEKSISWRHLCRLWERDLTQLSPPRQEEPTVECHGAPEGL